MAAKGGDQTLHGRHSRRILLDAGARHFKGIGWLAQWVSAKSGGLRRKKRQLRTIPVKVGIYFRQIP